MAYYRQIYVTFWTDSKVEEDFTPEDKYFYLYLLTNAHTNLCGCYEIGKRQMSNDTGYTVDVIERLLSRMSELHNVIRYNEQSKEVLLLNWHKYNWSKSDKLLKGVANEIERVKCPEFQKILLSYLAFYGYDVDTVSIGYTYPMDTSVTVSVTDTVINTVNNKHRFTPPTPTEVKAYITENGYHVDANAFIDFYTSCGWVIGKNKPMKDWKAAIRNWSRREKPKIKTAPSETHNYDMEALRRRAKE